MIKYPEKFDIILDGIKNGKYNLFLGAGVSLDSKDSHGNFLPSGNALKEILCNLKGIKRDTPLNRIMNSLTQSEKTEHLTVRFSNTVPGPTLADIPNYVWKRIFTFNIDDTIENIYSSSKNRKQDIFPSNYKDPFNFIEEKTKVQIIHLHGYAKRPSDNYVFNINEYINMIKESNTWMRVLADLIATDLFIISGISFNEPDFDYYTSFRTVNTPRKDMSPSILIEPNVDALIQQDCEKKGLALVHGKFSDFMEIVKKEIPNPPSIYDMTINTNNNFNAEIPKRELMEFFSDFEKLSFGNNEKSINETPFDYGYEPSYEDIISHKDIQRVVNQEIYSNLLTSLKHYKNSLILVTGLFYNGKTTSVLRCLNELALTGVTVYRLKTIRGFNKDNVVRCLNYTINKTFLYIDNIAEFIDQATEIIEKGKNVVIIGTERQYRVEHIKKIFQGSIKYINCDLLTKDEIKQLIEKYRINGRVANDMALRNIKSYIDENYKRTIGEHVCNILQDFMPLEKKISELLRFYNEEDIHALIIMAIGYHCFKFGLNYSIVQSILKPSYNLWNHFKKDKPFVFCFNNDDNDYVLPQNKLLIEKLLLYLKKINIKTVQLYYRNILIQLSYYVNRKSIMNRTPESRLSSRMLDIDKSLSFFFNDKVEELLKSIEREWGWNSRYWEQRALCVIDKDIDRAITYAKQAVAIERHPYPLTTLGKILFRKMKGLSLEKSIDLFEQAANYTLDAMSLEANKSMISMHPYMTLVDGCIEFSKGNAENKISQKLGDRIRMALTIFEDEIRLSQIEKKRLQEVLSWLNP